MTTAPCRRATSRMRWLSARCSACRDDRRPPGTACPNETKTVRSCPLDPTAASGTTAAELDKAGRAAAPLARYGSLIGRLVRSSRHGWATGSPGRLVAWGPHRLRPSREPLLRGLPANARTARPDVRATDPRRPGPQGIVLRQTTRRRRWAASTIDGVLRSANLLPSLLALADTLEVLLEAAGERALRELGRRDLAVGDQIAQRNRVEPPQIVGGHRRSLCDLARTHRSTGRRSAERPLVRPGDVQPRVTSFYGATFGPRRRDSQEVASSPRANSQPNHAFATAS